MGKKADKWKAKYDELMHITEGYIRHLHEAHSRLSRFGGVKLSSCDESRWDCSVGSDSGRYCCDTDEDDSASTQDLEAHIEELTDQLESKDKELASEMASAEDRLAELEETVSKLEDENGRLTYRVDDLETALRDLIGSAEELMETVHPLALVSTGARRVRGKEASEYDLWADLNATIREAQKTLGDAEESEGEESEAD